MEWFDNILLCLWFGGIAYETEASLLCKHFLSSIMTYFMFMVGLLVNYNKQSATMDFLQLIADLLHLVAMLILLYKIHQTHSVSGISYKTQ